MMQPLVFFGTPEFAVPTLRALSASEFRPSLVVSQPSRPSGRGRKLTEPPVVIAARELGIPFEQVTKVRDPEFLDRLRALAPEIAIVVAFGQIFPAALLDLPRRGCLNLHASLLPRWRGAAPIQAAIRAGDSETGVTTMIMEAGLDSGPLLLENRLAIAPDESATGLSARLSISGAELMLETLRQLEAGTLVGTPQDGSAATYAGKVTRDSARASWEQPAIEIERAVRAFQPWPGVELSIGADLVKLLQARAAPLPDVPAGAPAAPGTVLAIVQDELFIAAGESTALAIRQAQRAGRGPVTGAELARALGLVAGARRA